MEEAGEAPVWKRRGRVIWAAWAVERKGAVRTRAQEAELVQMAELALAARESER